LDQSLKQENRMKNRSYFTSALVALACAAACAAFLVITHHAAKQTALAAEASVQEVFVTFEGPWAIAPDPDDANNVLLLAPKTKHHRDLYVTASNYSPLAAGIYDLSFPGHVGPGAGASDPAILRAKIDPQNAQSVLDSKAGRYAIRLPKPEAYLPSHRRRSRAGSTYPPDASTEMDYATAFSLRYSVDPNDANSGRASTAAARPAGG
jgi:hypothetical protein